LSPKKRWKGQGRGVGESQATSSLLHVSTELLLFLFGETPRLGQQYHLIGPEVFRDPGTGARFYLERSSRPQVIFQEIPGSPFFSFQK
jgi:hypothetical protein